MKKKGVLLILVGIAGIIFVSTFDIIMGKPVNDVTGPKSIAGFIASIIFIISGIKILLK